MFKATAERWLLILLVMLTGFALTIAAIELGSSPSPRGWVVILAILILLIYWMRRDRAQAAEWIQAIHQRYNTGEFSSDLENLLAQEASGDHSLKTIISISYAYKILKNASQAEAYARRACAEVEQKKLYARMGLNAKYSSDMAYHALSDVLFIQGRFAEAARELRAYIPKSFHCNNIRARTAWAYFLAHDQENTRKIVSQIKSPQKGPRFALAPAMTFMVAYMQHELLNVDGRETLRSLEMEIQKWMGMQDANKDNPFGERLGEILNDMAPLLPMGWFHLASKRILNNQTPGLLAEALDKRANGDRSYQNTITLSAVYSHLGFGAEAEPLAREGLAAVEAEGYCEKTDGVSRFLCDIGFLAVYDALLMQGRFAEAAEILNPLIDKTERPNLTRIFVAHAFFLAGHLENANAVLAQVRPSTEAPQDNISHKYQLLVAYLEYKLLGMDTRERMRNLSEHLAKFDEEIERLAENPYRARLREMVAEIRELVA